LVIKQALLQTLYLRYQHMEYIVHNLEDLHKLSELFATAYLKTFRKVFFYGGIGAGKTTFIKMLCTRLGVVDFTSSPTFSLVNCYQIQNSNITVNHADLYRLKDSEEVFEAGLYELLYDEDYFFVEWPEIIETFYDDALVKVFFEADDEEIRYVRVVLS
jgi:tRNA threonylcarbamoyladenosine biosynthesis protein TsaE